VVAIGDYLGTGTDDILFRNNATGDTGFYAMVNGVNTGWHDVGGSSTAYQVISSATAAETVGAGGQLEVANASSSTVTFLGATGKLILDHSATFTGQIVNLTGNGNLSSSDQIDLKDIAFGSGTHESYSGNTAGGTLTISDANGDTAHLTLVGNYTNSTFTLSSDGDGGTIVIDPPIGTGSNSQQFNFDSFPSGSSQAVAPSHVVAIGGTGNNGFIFSQSTGGSAGNSSALGELVSNVHGSSANPPTDAHLDHSWTEPGLGHPSFVEPHFAQLHAGDFMMH
jgi:hypothetical protein